MRPRRSGPISTIQGSAFKGFRFPPEIMVLAVRWYLRYGLSCRDVEELLGKRGIEVDHVTIYRWVQPWFEQPRSWVCTTHVQKGQQHGCHDSGGIRMPLGLSIFLLAAGAILAFAFTGDVSGLNIDTVGWILMAVGALGVLISLVVWAPFTTTSRRTTVVEGVSGVGQRRTYVDDGSVV